MASKIKSLLLSIKKALSISTPKQAQQLQRDTTPLILYRTIRELPLSVFIDCIVNDNRLALVKQGIPTPGELSETWDILVSEYAAAVGDHEYKLYLTLLKETGTLQATVTRVNNLVAFLKSVYHEPFAKELNKLLRAHFVFNPDDPETYHANLRGCITMLCGIELRLKLKADQFESIQKKHQSDNKAPTEEYFLSVLITLTDHSGVRLQTHEITVWEFAERLKRFNRHCEQLEKQIQKK